MQNASFATVPDTTRNILSKTERGDIAAAGGLGYEIYGIYAAGSAAVAAGAPVAIAVAAPVAGAIFARIGLLSVTYAILAE